MDVASLKEEFVGHQFDEVEFDVQAGALAEYAAACGETAEYYVDPTHPDLRAVTNYTSRYHGRRSLPDGFPIKMFTIIDTYGNIIMIELKEIKTNLGLDISTFIFKVPQGAEVFDMSK